MASIGKSSTLFIQVLFVLALALLLVTCLAGRYFPGNGLGEMKVPKQSSLNCNTVHPVQDGETCSAIVQTFSLTATGLSTLNPNLVCDKLFVGQWLCVAGGILAN